MTFYTQTKILDGREENMDTDTGDVTSPEPPMLSPDSTAGLDINIDKAILNLLDSRKKYSTTGEIDEDIDSRLDLHNMKAEPLNPVPHGI